MAQRRDAERQEFRELAARLAADQPAYYSYLLKAVLQTTYIGALFGIVGGLIAAIGQGLSAANLYYIANFVFVGAQLAALLGDILILNIARGALVMIKEVPSVREPGTFL